jgi:hypothetical protein
MKKDSRYVWYVVDALIFMAINVILWIFHAHEISNSLGFFDTFGITVFALGIWRLTDIITHESVTDFIRAPFMDQDAEGKWVMSEKGFRGFAGTLVSCNACMGVWVSMIIFYLFVFFPIPTFAFMIIMTLTCLERFLSKIYNLLEKRG